MVAHAVVWAKLVALGAILLAVVLLLVGGVYLCFTINIALGVVAVLVPTAGVPAGLYLTLRHFSRTGVIGGLRLLTRRADAGEGTPAVRQEHVLLGGSAVAETALRPSGAIRVDEQRIIATSEAGFVEKGATVKIIKAVGMNVVVREVKAQS
jgi:membrane-bound serine protease (ClpP class)